MAMSWFTSSWLPEPLIVIETWLVRMFLLLAVLSIVPLGLFFVYDFLLYIWRTIMFEIPFIGGRAQGRRKPRAPSFKENVPSRRIMAMVGNETGTSDEMSDGRSTQSHIPTLEAHPQRKSRQSEGD